MSLIEECEKLRKLEQQATCAPWYIAECEDGDCDEINGRMQSCGTGVSVYDREMGIFHPEKVKIRCGPEEFEDDYSMESICSPDKEANAKFIAESRNLILAMLEILGCFQEGDASGIKLLIAWLDEMQKNSDFSISPDHMQRLRRLQKAATLMEQERK